MSDKSWVNALNLTLAFLDDTKKKCIYNTNEFSFFSFIINYTMVIKVAVFGGSKHIGREMVVQGLEKGGYEFKLLLRTPENAEYTEEQRSKISIVKGDALDHNAVKETVQGTDVIVFSIGSAFDFKKMTMVTPNICQNTMKVLLDVLKNDFEENERPKRLVVVSSTGLDDLSEVPYLFVPLYKYMLHDPHEDKRVLEKLVIENDVVSNYILVRPTLLTDGKLTGKYKAKEGISGYTVSRADLGHFLLHQCLEPTTWIHKKVVVSN